MFPFAAPQSGSASSGVGMPDAVALLTRAPKLKDAIERATTAFVKSLQKMASNLGAVDGHLRHLAVRDMRDIVSDHTSSTVAGIINCATPPCVMLASIDGMLVHALVDLLCGGGGREAPPSPLRAATAIDQQFAHIVFKLFASAIEAEWAQAGIGAASAMKCEAVVADLLGTKVKEAGCIDLSISIFGVAGTLRLVVPPIVLELFGSDEVSGQRSTESVDPLWAGLLRKEIGHASVQLHAYLDAHDIDLAFLASLDVGQIIVLPAQSRLQASLVAQGQVLFRGEIGQGDDRYSVRIDDVISDAWRPSPMAVPTFHSRMSDSLKA